MDIYEYIHRLFCGIREATTKAISFAERLAFSNWSTKRHIPEEWILHQHRYGNPKSRVNPIFERWQIQQLLEVQ
jgi:hypothetical protein